MEGGFIPHLTHLLLMGSLVISKKNCYMTIVSHLALTGYGGYLTVQVKIQALNIYQEYW